MSSNEKKMKKQCKVFATAEKMPILAEDDAHVGTQVNIAAIPGLSVSRLNTMVSQWSEIDRSYSCCGPSFSKEVKSLMTSTLEELETILLVWFKQAHTANTSIN
jgi:hypothetical protein